LDTLSGFESVGVGDIIYDGGYLAYIADVSDEIENCITIVWMTEIDFPSRLQMRKIRRGTFVSFLKEFKMMHLRSHMESRKQICLHQS
jgi:hypothetical protein